MKTIFSSFLSLSASAFVNCLPPGVNQITAARLFDLRFLDFVSPDLVRIWETAFTTGSAVITIPGPPPYGRSSIFPHLFPEKFRGFWYETLIFFSRRARPIIDELR